MIRKYSQILGIPLICLAFVPIAGLGFALPKLTLIATLALMLSVTTPFSSVLSSLPGKFLLSFIIILALSPLWSVAPIVSILGNPPRYMGLLAQLCAIIVGLSFVTVEKETTYKALLLANIVVVTLGILQMLHLDPFASYFADEAFLGRIFATVGHPNALAQCILLTAPFVLMLRSRSYATMLFILNATVLLGTASRSALLGLFVLLVLFGFFVRRHIVKLRLYQAFGAALLIVLVASVGALTFERRFSQTFTAARSTSARSIIAETSIAMVIDRPMGWGLETLAFTSPHFLPKEIYQYENLNTVIDRAHSIVLELLVTLGPLGLITFGLFIMSLLIALWKKQEHIVFGSLLGYLACLLFNFPSQASNLLFWVIVGYGLSTLTQKKSLVTCHLSLVTRAVSIVISLIMLIISTQWIVARVQADPSLFSYDRELLINETEKRLMAGETEYVDALIDQLRFLTNSEDGMALLLEGWKYAVEGDSERATKRIELAAFYFPESIRYHRVAAHIYETLGDERLRDLYQAALINLLPPAYFDENSELRRILLKQHPWLEGL